MKSIPWALALIVCALAGSAVAEGACPPGYFQTNNGAPGPVGCAPIPEQAAPIRYTLRWGAVAGDGEGNWGMSESRRLRLLAEREALKQCRERSQKKCRLVQVYGDQCVAMASDGITASVPARITREAAEEAALKDCASYAEDRECRITYSACSKL